MTPGNFISLKLSILTKESEKSVSELIMRPNTPEKVDVSRGEASILKFTWMGKLYCIS